MFYDSAHATEFPADMEPHFTPSWNRVDHIKLDNDFNPEPYRNRYRNALYYIDGQIERVLNAVEAQGGLENTIIVITSDHGQEFNDNHKNYWGHGSN
nr:sulfatase-like hydrolase/transferase [Vibrio fluvialis]